MLPPAVDAALRSEQLIHPEARTLDDTERPGRGKVLLLRDTATAVAGEALRLTPCRTDDDWAAYTRRRIEVEAGFGLDEAAARELVRRTRSRSTTLGLRLWLAREDGAVVGAIGAFTVPGTDVARLQEVDVFPGHRGRGRGNTLLEAARRQLLTAGARLVVVGADEDDWPLGWYLRRGFTPAVRVSTGAGDAAPPR